MTDIKVGDRVLVTGTAKKVIPGVGVLVEMFSKTDQWDGWIREADVTFAGLAVDLPDEPPDGTWLISDTISSDRSVFHRNDTQGCSDPDRRHRRRWWDMAAGEWIDWPTAFSRGANPNKRLREETS